MDLWERLDLVATVCITLAVIFVILLLLDRCHCRHLREKHVLITGGSSGIGLALAQLCAQRGAAHITLVARDKVKLVEAQVEVERSRLAAQSQQVHVVSLDITTDQNTVQSSLDAVTHSYGPVDVLINCAGSAVAAKFEQTSEEDFQRMMELNYLGSVRVTQALLPAMKRAEDGLLVFVSSQAGLMGVFGFTAYTAAKFAIRGFAEALDMEVKAHGINVTLAFPPDTDTPGFHEEEKGKPEETRLISQSSGLFLPETVARSILDDALRGKFYSSPGLDGWTLTTLCGGMTDSSLAQVLVQMAVLGPLRFIGWAHRQYFYRLIRGCRAKRNSDKKQE